MNINININIRKEVIYLDRSILNLLLGTINNCFIVPLLNSSATIGHITTIKNTIIKLVYSSKKLINIPFISLILFKLSFS